MTPQLKISKLKNDWIGPINLEVNSGEIVGVFGPSGSGKTRFFRAIADLDPHQGELYLNGIESKAMEAPMWRARVALIPSQSFWWEERVEDHFSTKNKEYFEYLGFTQTVFRKCIEVCSSGEKQRLSLLRSLEGKPSVVLLDEPTSHLDRRNVSLVETFILKYVQEAGASVLWISHDQEQLEGISNKVYQMEVGHLKRVQ